MKVSAEWLARKDVLGTAVDQELADRWRVSRQRVFEMRRYFNIPPFTPAVDWTAVDDLLGTVTDVSLSESTGISESGIRQRRQKKKIAAYRKSAAPDYGKPEYDQLVEAGGSAGNHSSGKFKRARTYARRNNLRWPIGLSRRGGDGPPAAWAMFMAGATWEEVAAELKYKNATSATGVAYEHASRNGLPLPNKKNRALAQEAKG